MADVIVAAGSEPDVALLEALSVAGRPEAGDSIRRWLAAGGASRRSGVAALLVGHAARSAETAWFDDHLGWVAQVIQDGVAAADPDAGRALPALAAVLRRQGQHEAADRVVAQGSGPYDAAPGSGPAALVTQAVDLAARPDLDGIALAPNQPEDRRAD